MPLGFLVIYVVSLIDKAPSKEMQAFIDEIRKPRGRTVLEEKTTDRLMPVELRSGVLRAPLLFGRHRCLAAAPSCRHSARLLELRP